MSSELTLAEVLVTPFQIQRDDIAAVYEELIQDSDRLTVAPVSREILVLAASLRAESSIPLPDLIHVTTAATTRCDRFLTNDRRLKPPPGWSFTFAFERF